MHRREIEGRSPERVGDCTRRASPPIERCTTWRRVASRKSHGASELPASGTCSAVAHDPTQFGSPSEEGPGRPEPKMPPQDQSPIFLAAACWNVPFLPGSTEEGRPLRFPRHCSIHSATARWHPQSRNSRPFGPGSRSRSPPIPGIRWDGLCHDRRPGATIRGSSARACVRPPAPSTGALSFVHIPLSRFRYSPNVFRFQSAFAVHLGCDRIRCTSYFCTQHPVVLSSQPSTINAQDESRGRVHGAHNSPLLVTSDSSLRLFLVPLASAPRLVYLSS